MGKTEQKLTLFLLFIILIGWIQGTTSKAHYSSSYRIPCKDTCDKHDNDYFWCNTEKGWDYCSPKENTDYKGQTCREDHPCRSYGKSYHWCYTEGGNWGYCGLQDNSAEPKTLLYLTSTYQSMCLNDCLYHENGQYFSCDTDDGWDYCSPLPHVTYKNEPCRLDHFCASYEDSYSWCLTNSGYDRCGFISDGECKHVIQGHKEKTSNVVISCKWSHKEIEFIGERDLTVSSEGSTWKNEIINLISLWKNTYLNTNASSKMITTKQLKFNVETLVNQESQQHYILKIIVKEYHSVDRNPVLALVLVPDNKEVPDRFVRLAFIESFHLRARISMNVTESSYIF